MALSGIRNHAVEIAVGTGALIALSYAVKKLTVKKSKITRIIDTMEIFKKSSVHIRDPEAVEEKVSILMKGGAARLQIVSDFDATISCSHMNGLRVPSTFAVIRQSPFFPEENRYQSNLLFDQYYPISIDPNLSIEEKAPYMREWHDKSTNIISQSGLKKGHIEDVVHLANLVLREGCNVLFQLLHRHDVPLLVYSAGIGDIIKEALKQKNLLHPNVKVIANCMEYNDEERVVGFKGEQILSINKNRFCGENVDYFDHLKARYNIILLGDALGDAIMADSVEDANCILKIGFLNEKIEENLPTYLKAYDIVLADDQTMDLPIGLLQTIL